MPTLQQQDELLSIQEASSWASSFLKRVVTESNISYLIQYGRVRKIGENGTTQIIKSDLIKYYEKSRPSREMSWKKTQKVKGIFSKFKNWIFSHFQFIILKTQHEYNFAI